MLSKLQKVFAPPFQSDLYRERLRANLRAILMVMAASFVIAFVVNEAPESRIGLGAMIVFLTIVIAVALKGDMTFARSATPFVAFLAVSYLVFTGNGIHSVTVPALLVIVVCARALGSGTSSVIYMVLSMVTLGGAYWTGETGMVAFAITDTDNEVKLANLYIELIALTAAVWFLAKNIEDDRDFAYQTARELQGNKDALAEKELQYRLLADNAQDFIWTADLDLNYTYCSPSCERIVGYKPEELVGKSIFFSLKPDFSIQDVKEEIERNLERERQSPNTGRSSFAQVEFIRKDGSVGFVEAQLAFLRDESQNVIGIVGTSRDISEKMEAETKAKEISDQLRQAQKIDSIGQLAGGIAHDFNNMLVAIQGYSDLASKHKSTPVDVQRYISEIRKAAVRAENLTRQLLTFSRRQAMESRPVALNTLLLDLQNMLSRLIPANVKVNLDLSDDLYEILGDAGQLEQLVVNLCVNARDAMPSGGLLTLSSKNVSVTDEVAAKYPNTVAGEYVQLCVEDNGTGMEQALQNRIFEPFFTTKKEGQGTGLGLSVVHGIVIEHGGFIEIDSREGEGSRIMVHFPRSDNAAPTRSLIEVNDSVAGGMETVLVVEDEEQVRDLAKLVLSQAGYTVLTAADGMLGWELFLAQRENISIVICDVVMPNMGGRQLLRLIREIDESIPFIFTSGYVGGPDPRNFADRYDVEFLQKPFSAASLQQKVRTTLDGREHKQPHQRTVLAVDDSESILHLLELDVRELGHNIMTALSGEAAVELCKEHEFDVIFMDIQMQGMNGIDTTVAIRNASDGSPRIIGLTAHHTEEEKERCLAAGMDEVITKPIRYDRLSRVLGGRHEEEIKAEQVAQTAPVFDVDVSLHLANNRPEVAREMFAILIDKLPEDQKAMNLAIATEDFDEFRQQVHKLNGAVRYCGVPALSDSINQLETLAKTADKDDVKDALDAVNQRIAELIDWHAANPDPFSAQNVGTA